MKNIREMLEQIKRDALAGYPVNTHQIDAILAALPGEAGTIADDVLAKLREICEELDADSKDLTWSVSTARHFERYRDRVSIQCRRIAEAKPQPAMPEPLQNAQQLPGNVTGLEEIIEKWGYVCENSIDGNCRGLLNDLRALAAKQSEADKARRLGAECAANSTSLRILEADRQLNNQTAKQEKPAPGLEAKLDVVADKLIKDIIREQGIRNDHARFAVLEALKRLSDAGLLRTEPLPRELVNRTVGCLRLWGSSKEECELVQSKLNEGRVG